MASKVEYRLVVEVDGETYLDTKYTSIGLVNGAAKHVTAIHADQHDVQVRIQRVETGKSQLELDCEMEWPT